MNAERTPTVLVVDDDREHALALMKVLERAGYSVCGAGNGHEALALLTERPIELVITDLRMPGMGGMELLRSIQATSPQVAVIILTAFGEWTSYMHAMESGAVDYLNKPARRDDILLAVRKALARRGVQASLLPTTSQEEAGERAA